MVLFKISWKFAKAEFKARYDVFLPETISRLFLSVPCAQISLESL